MSRMICLMYHALYASEEEYQRLPGEERGYAVHVDVFAEQLARIREHAVAIGPADLDAAVAREPARCRVLLTFDDGHVSNYMHAFPLLRQNRMQAIFFVTTDFVEGRSDYCRWENLREMAASGMSIQSHGVTHRFFDDLGREGESEELRRSKVLIEKNTGSHVDAISFPGGRYSACSMQCGADAGYGYFYSSKTGVNKLPLLPGSRLIMRIAVKQSMGMCDFVRYIRADRVILLRANVLSLLKSLLKRLLGNSFYHSLYKKISS